MSLMVLQAGPSGPSGGGFTPAAKASFDELNSLYAKLSTDAQVTAVSSAINQAFARHGV